MLNPQMMYIDPVSPISPSLAMACRIPRLAADDWISPVTSAPTKIPIIGFDMVIISCLKPSYSLRGAMAVLMSSIPIKRNPRPRITCPKYLTEFLLTNRFKINPINANIGATAVIFKATSCPVIVVPILAPIITPTAC